MAAEEHGAEKKAESFAWMLQYIRSQGQQLGKAYVNFAEPVSLRQVRTERKLATEKIAFEVLHRINRVTPVTPTSLLTLALLGIGDRALTSAEIRSVLDPLLDYVAVRKLPQAGTVDLAAPGGLLPALDALVSTKVVTRFTGGVEPVYAHRREPAPGGGLLPQPDHPLLRHPGDHRAGPAPPRPPSGRPPRRERDLGARAWTEALRLRDLLKYEFFFAAKPEFAEELRAELAILDPDWERKAGDPDRHRHRPGRAAAAPRPSGPGLVPRGLHGRRRPAGRPPTGPGRGEVIPRRVHWRGQPVPAAATASTPASRSPRRSSATPCRWPPVGVSWPTPGPTPTRSPRSPAGGTPSPPSSGRSSTASTACGAWPSPPWSAPPPRRAGMTSTKEELRALLAEIESGPEGPGGRRLLRLRRHPHRRLLRRGLRPRRHPPPQGRPPDDGPLAAGRPRHAAAGERRHRPHGDRRRGGQGPAGGGPDRARPAPLPGAGGRHRLPRGPGDREGPPAQGPHPRAGVVGHPVPGRPPGRRPRHRARAVHAGGSGGRAPHRPHRRPGPVGEEQGRRRRRLRRRQRHQAGRELRLRQRRRGRRVPRDRRPAPPAQPRLRPGPVGGRAGLADPPLRTPGPSRDRPDGPHRRGPRRHLPRRSASVSGSGSSTAADRGRSTTWPPSAPRWPWGWPASIWS